MTNQLTPPSRRDVLRGVGIVGAFLVADLGALLYANNWIGPARLTPQVFLDGFAKVFGRQPGFRKNHAKGVAVAGCFDSNGNGRGLSKARCFGRGARRWSAGFRWPAANPHAADTPAAARGLGLAFGFPGEQQWRMATLNLPVFLDNSPQGFYDRLIASAVVPGTGKPDPTAMARFLAAHPETARLWHRRAASADTRFRRQHLSRVQRVLLRQPVGVRGPVRWSLARCMHGAAAVVRGEGCSTRWSGSCGPARCAGD